MRAARYMILMCVFLMRLTRTTSFKQSKLPEKPEIFPDLFKMEDYYKCPPNSVFCAASLNLIPKHDNCTIWRQLQDWSISPTRYNRTLVHRKMCVPKILTDKSKMDFIDNKTNIELKTYELGAKTYHLNCMEEKTPEANMKFLATLLVIYLTLLLIATMYDLKVYDEHKHTKLEQLLVCFSLNNYKKMSGSSIAQGEDYRRLKCIQGIRTYQAIVEITGHTVLGMQQKYIRNPEFVEEIFDLNIIQMIIAVAMVIIEIYFLISTWLLTYQILSMHEQNGKFSIRDAGLLVVQRIARLWPTLLLMIFIGLPIFNHMGYGPGTFEMFNMTNEACAKYWWLTLLFASNFVRPYKTCHIGMWSLPIDGQLYLMVIIAMYVVLNCKLNLKKCVAGMFLLSYLSHVMLIVDKDLGRSSWPNLKLLTSTNVFYDEKMWHGYYGFRPHASSGVLGILFGYFYYSSKKAKGQKEPYGKFYLTVSLVLTLVSLLASYGTYTPNVEAFVLPLFKPAFSGGIAIAIYGISTNVIEGYVKTMCENKYAIMLGNFSYCTYLSHFLFLFKRYATCSEPIEFNLFNICLAQVEDVVLSFILGIIATVTVELPFIYVKKLVLPPMWKKTVKPSDNVEEDSKRK